MKAAILRNLNEPLSIEEVEVADVLPDEVLIRTLAAGVCHSDLSVIQGKLPQQLPMVLGHEGAGIVEAVGANVSYVQPGDQVTTCLSIFCGECDYCLSGHPATCVWRIQGRPGDRPPRLSQGGQGIGALVGLGSFAEKMLVDQRTVVKVDARMPAEVAALMSCAVCTGLGAVLNTAQVPATATVAVVGCGGVGLNAIQGARISGATRIIAVDIDDAKLKLALEFGATDIVNAAQVDAVEAVRDLTGGGVEYSFEVVGSGKTLHSAVNMLRPRGVVTLIGVVNGEQIQLPEMLASQERRLLHSSMGSNRFRRDFPRWTDLYLQGRLKLDELISSRIRLDDVNEGFKAFNDASNARTVIVFD